MSQQLMQGYGAEPVAATDTDETTLASLDPARDILLGLFKAALLSELTPRWGDAVSGTPLENRAAVETALPQEPDDQLLRSDKVIFPALFVYRPWGSQATADEFTLSQDRRTRQFNADYILGGLGTYERRKLLDVLTFAESKLLRVLASGGHRAYLEQTLPSGRKHLVNVLLGSNHCGFSTVTPLNSQAGIAAFTPESPKYFALSIDIQVTELHRATQNSSAYQGASLGLGTGTDAGLIPDLVQSQSKA